MANRKPAIRIIPTFDWPLEGFRTFEQSRFHFASVLDALLPNLVSWPDSTGLAVGGQTKQLENFLEVMPAKYDEVHLAVRSGRLLVGPWYTEPDVFLVSGEAIIRNLLAGLHASEHLGGRLNVGTLMESSGATGQFPQILRGFGLTAVVMKRGVGADWGEFWWEAPDGTGIALFQPVSILQSGDLVGTKADLQRALRDIRDMADERSNLNPLLVFAGGPEGVLSGSDLASLLDLPGKNSSLRIDVASLGDALISAATDVTEWPSVIGELRTPGWQPIWMGSASGRMWIKQRNSDVQHLLEQWAEPFSTWHHGLSGSIGSASADHLRHAWQILLDNHNPAAIRGATLDLATREIAARFDRAEQIGQEVTNSALQGLAASLDFRLLPVDGPFLPLVVFNASDTRRTDLLSVDLELTDEYQIFEIVDDGGKHVSFEALVPEDSEPGGRRVRVRFVAGDVPPFGYRTYAIRPFHYFDGEGYDDTPGYSITNEWLTVTLDPNVGTFTLFDKRNGRSYSGLNRYVDGGDRGDLFTYCPPARDTVIDIAANTPLQTDRITGPITESLHFLEIYRLPERLSDSRDARLPMAAQFVPISIDTTVQLSKHVPRVDVSVRVSCSAHDHRLRVHFPSGIGTPRALFGSHFEVVERDVKIPGPDDTTQWAEFPSADFPFQGFVTLMGDETGLTIASPNLSEAGVIANGSAGSELALTLLRAVGWLCRDDLPNRRINPAPPTPAPGAQTTSEFEYTFNLIPHDTDLYAAWALARESLTPLRGILANPGEGALPLSGSLLEVDNPAFVVSAIKQSEDRSGVIIRGYNLSDDEQEIRMVVNLPFTSVRSVQLDESDIAATQPSLENRGTIMFRAASHQIVTLLLND